MALIRYTFYIDKQAAQFTLKKSDSIVVSEIGQWQDSHNDKKVASETSGDKPVCKERTQMEDMEWGDVCFFKNKNIMQAYNESRLDGISNKNDDDVYKYLEKNLSPPSGKDRVVTKAEDHVGVTYHWVNSKDLNITLSFDGGVTTVEFKERSDGTYVYTTYSAD